MTYSFPCQDLSLAGKGKGMSDTSTRSGMLWEVERILTECHELGSMPQILLMENVPQVHSQDNIRDFHKWQLRLEELGYKNYMQDLIATDYGIPQTRNRCFMVSILGDYSYTFPKPIPLKLKLKDLLEDNVDEKYFISQALTKYITKKVRYGGVIFENIDGDLLNSINCSLFEHRGDDDLKLLPMLNDEVEILEEEKKIPEKIPEEIIVGKKQPVHRIKKIEKKINEIIDYLDYLKSKGDE